MLFYMMTQKKLLSDAMAANKTKTVKKRKQRTKAVMGEEFIPQEKLIDVSNEGDSSETESDDVVDAVVKRRNVALGKISRPEPRA